MNRGAEATAELRTAERLDPANRISTGAVCWGQVMAHRAAEAVSQCRRALDLDSTLAVAHLWVGQAYELLGDSAQALRALETGVRHGRRSAVSLAALAHALARFGRGAEARKIVAELESRPDQYRPSYEIGAIYAALGDKDAAFRELERAVAERSHSVVLMKVDPAIDRLRDDPRLARLTAKVGLP